MATQNTKTAALNASYVIDSTQGNITLVMTAKKEAENEEATEKSVAAFAPNKRYSIYNNGGGYTGL